MRLEAQAQIVEVVLCIVHLVTGLEKLPLAEVLTRHKRHTRAKALGIYSTYFLGEYLGSPSQTRTDTCGASHSSSERIKCPSNM